MTASSRHQDIANYPSPFSPPKCGMEARKLNVLEDTDLYPCILRLTWLLILTFFCSLGIFPFCHYWRTWLAAPYCRRMVRCAAANQEPVSTWVWPITARAEARPPPAQPGSEEDYEIPPLHIWEEITASTLLFVLLKVKTWSVLITMFCLGWDVWCLAMLCFLTFIHILAVKQNCDIRIR